MDLCCLCLSEVSEVSFVETSCGCQTKYCISCYEIFTKKTMNCCVCRRSLEKPVFIRFTKKYFLENELYKYRYEDIKYYFHQNLGSGRVNNLTMSSQIGQLCSNFILCYKFGDGINLDEIYNQFGIFPICHTENHIENDNYDLSILLKKMFYSIDYEISGTLIDRIFGENLYELICLFGLNDKLKLVSNEQGNYRLYVPIPSYILNYCLFPSYLLNSFDIKITVSYNRINGMSRDIADMITNNHLCVRHYFMRKADSSALIMFQNIINGDDKFFNKNKMVSVNKNMVIQIGDLIQEPLKFKKIELRIDRFSFNMNSIFFYIYDNETNTYVTDIVDIVDEFQIIVSNRVIYTTNQLSQHKLKSSLSHLHMIQFNSLCEVVDINLDENNYIKQNYKDDAKIITTPYNMTLSFNLKKSNPDYNLCLFTLGENVFMIKNDFAGFYVSN